MHSTFAQYVKEPATARGKGLIVDPKYKHRRSDQTIYCNLFSSSRGFPDQEIHPILADTNHFSCARELYKEKECSCLESPLVIFLGNLKSAKLYKINKEVGTYQSFTYELVFISEICHSITRKAVTNLENLVFGGEVDYLPTKYPEQADILRYGIHFSIDYILTSDSIGLRTPPLKAAPACKNTQGSPLPPTGPCT